MSPAKGALVTLSIRGISICAQLVFFVMIARVSTMEVVGVFAAASACWVLGRALLPMGWNVAVLRSVSVLRVAGNSGQATTILKVALMETAILGTALGVIMVIVTVTFVGKYTLELVLASIVALLWAEMGILVSFLRGLGDLLWSQLCDGVVVYVVPLAVCGAMVVGNLTIDFLTIAATYAGSAVLSLVLLVAASMKRVVPGTANPMRAFGIRSQRRLARRLWWNQAFSALSGRASILLAAPVAGPATTAVVEAGLRTQLVGATLAWAGGTVASPRYAVAHSNNNTDGSKILSTVTWAALLPSLLVVIVLSLWGEPILEILGSSYAVERWAITMMALAAVIELPAATGGYFLMMTGREHAANRSTIVQLGVLIVLILILGPYFGASGIACSVLIASGIRSFMVVMSLRRDGVPSPLAIRGLQTLVNGIWNYVQFRK